jgi:hypothetical protein
MLFKATDKMPKRPLAQKSSNRIDPILSKLPIDHRIRQEPFVLAVRDVPPPILSISFSYRLCHVVEHIRHQRGKEYSAQDPGVEVLVEQLRDCEAEIRGGQHRHSDDGGSVTPLLQTPGIEKLPATLRTAIVLPEACEKAVFAVDVRARQPHWVLDPIPANCAFLLPTSRCIPFSFMFQALEKCSVIWKIVIVGERKEMAPKNDRQNSGSRDVVLIACCK